MLFYHKTLRNSFSSLTCCFEREDSGRHSRSCFPCKQWTIRGNIATNLHDRAFCLPKSEQAFIIQREANRYKEQGWENFQEKERMS